MKIPSLRIFASTLLITSSLHAVPIDTSKYSQPIRVACIGDSITSGATITDPSMFYPSQLQAMLGSEWVVRNFGASGRTLLKKGDNPYWIESIYRDSLSFLPNVVVIMLGSNDTKSYNWVHSGDFIADYKDLIASYKNLPSHPQIYICYPPPVFGAGAYNITEANVEKEILMIDQIAKEENVRVTDMHKPLESTPSLLPDTVHPNAEGATVMAATVFSALTDKNPPTPSEQEANRAITLRAADAIIDGTGAHLENNGADSDIGYWGNTAETISWNTNVPRAGVYNVSVTYAVPTSNAGSEVEVTVGNKAISAKIAGTSDTDWQTFKTIDFGNISIPQAGPVDVILAANLKPADYIMNVRSIALSPTNLQNPTTPSHPSTRYKIAITPKNHGPAGTLNLWYQKPANAWVEALPVGNGRLGAMIFGGIAKEHLQLNEATLWAGSPYDQDNTNAINVIPLARKLIFEGKAADAVNLINAGAMSVPVKQMPYQTLGDLNLTFPVTDGKITDYQRSLDLSNAIATTTFKMGGVTYTREVFSSAPAQTIVVHLTADKPGSISFNAKLSSPQQNVVVCADGNALTVTGRSGDFQGITGQVIFHSRLIAKNEGGTVTATDDGLKVDGADSVTLLLSAATSYTSWNDVTGDPVARAKEPLEKAASLSYEDILNAHIADYQKLFNRVTFTLPLGPDSSLPTDQRLLSFDNGKDPQLAALFFQFGRYLLISCSRPGGQPATLQGLWNDSLTPPWESKYTININTEMNYWPAEPDNLSECAEPLFAMISDISQTGARTAKSMYGARGWVAHHNTDGWRATGPIDFAPTGMWPMGGAWLCTHLWEHYQFTGDKEFLKKAYPIMKGSCDFFFDTLVEHPKYHYLVTCPSYSPENGTQTAGPTMDNEILRDLFSETAAAAKILGVDQPFQEQALATMKRLPPLKIGKGGQLQEWIEDLDSPDDHNRHVSHLYGLYPSSQINAKTPEFFKAARQSLLWRGDAGTGWSLAWKINFWARLLDGDHAFLILSNQLSLPGSHGQSFDTGGGTFPNLFDAHPPFQIDGNFGAVSGMTEMLLQSHTGEIDLLPALPSAWPEGQITGLRARGGYEISETWAGGKLTVATIKSIYGSNPKVHYGDKTIVLKLAPGDSVNLNSMLLAQPAPPASPAATK